MEGELWLPLSCGNKPGKHCESSDGALIIPQGIKRYLRIVRTIYKQKVVTILTQTQNLITM